MKKSLILGAAAMIFAFTAAAQEAPKFEAYVGYTFTHFSPSGRLSNVPSDIDLGSNFGLSTFNAEGGGVQAGWNYNKWLGLVVDSSAAHHGDIGFTGRGTAVNFVAGPRFSLRKWSKVRLFAEVMFGGAYYNTSAFVPMVTPDPTVNNGVVPIAPDTLIFGRENRGQTAFAMLAGGGVDIRINKRISIRPIQADYYMTKFKNMQAFENPNGLQLLDVSQDNRQNNFRYSAGVNFTFGAR